jgi:serine/threonine-protein kinase
MSQESRSSDDAVKAGDSARTEDLLASLETKPFSPGSVAPEWQGPACIEPDTQLPCRFGDFELTEELGKGGMGVVYKARHTILDRTVALKLIRPDLLSPFGSKDRMDLVARFRNEVQAAARLEHDHVLTVYDVGEINGQLYYAMRFVRGESLRDKLEHGPLEPEAAARYIAQIADALNEAHAIGILHRDVKPHNVLVEEKTDRALLADFGLAKLTERDQQLTASDAVLGSPPYMSPEQTVDASRVTAASDIYGLGATLYHLLTGRPPFQAANATATMLQVQSMPPVSPRALNPAIPRDLETICLKCLNKRETDRYPTAHEVRDELLRFLSGQPIRAKPPTPLQLFIRWYPKHASMMLGAYYVVSPMTWVFYIVGGLLQSEGDGQLRLSSLIFLPWACAWIGLGYMMLKRGFWFELINIPVIAAFAALPLWLSDHPQDVALIALISLFGVALQIGAMCCRVLPRRKRHSAPS